MVMVGAVVLIPRLLQLMGVVGNQLEIAGESTPFYLMTIWSTCFG
jgi:hypothetical protein